jgi:hypothetical protein
MSEALIVAEVRIPIGKAPRGSLHHTRPAGARAHAGDKPQRAIRRRV